MELCHSEVFAQGSTGWQTVTDLSGKHSTSTLQGQALYDSLTLEDRIQSNMSLLSNWLRTVPVSSATLLPPALMATILSCVTTVLGSTPCFRRFMAFFLAISSSFCLSMWPTDAERDLQMWKQQASVL